MLAFRMTGAPARYAGRTLARSLAQAIALNSAHRFLLSNVSGLAHSRPLVYLWLFRTALDDD